MPGSGWIKLYRQLSESDFWLKEPFTRGQAWVDLLFLANHKDGFIRVRGNRVEVKRGQVGWSARKLSTRWKWSRGKTLRFLSELESENEQKIVTQKNAVSTIITIVNYNKYQSKRDTERATDVPQTGHRQYHNKNDKKEKNEKKNTIAPHPLLKKFALFANEKTIPSVLIETFITQYGEEATRIELTKAHNWLLGDPKRRKKLYGRFLSTWFNNADVVGNGLPGAMNNFLCDTCRNNYETSDPVKGDCPECVAKKKRESTPESSDMKAMFSDMGKGMSIEKLEP